MGSCLGTQLQSLISIRCTVPDTFLSSGAVSVCLTGTALGITAQQAVDRKCSSGACWPHSHICRTQQQVGVHKGACTPGVRWKGSSVRSRSSASSSHRPLWSAAQSQERATWLPGPPGLMPPPAGPRACPAADAGSRQGPPPASQASRRYRVVLPSEGLRRLVVGGHHRWLPGLVARL